jgi:hypothetical protein
LIPRGEVGLIFANIGLGLSLAGQPIINQGTFSVVVIMSTAYSRAHVGRIIVGAGEDPFRLAVT